MTFVEYVKAECSKAGLFGDQLSLAVLTIYNMIPVLKGRWNDFIEDYPDIVFSKVQQYTSFVIKTVVSPL